jgi:hypothetical protein
MIANTKSSSKTNARELDSKLSDIPPGVKTVQDRARQRLIRHVGCSVKCTKWLLITCGILEYHAKEAQSTTDLLSKLYQDAPLVLVSALFSHIVLVERHAACLRLAGPNTLSNSIKKA